MAPGMDSGEPEKEMAWSRIRVKPLYLRLLAQEKEGKECILKLRYQANRLRSYPDPTL